MPFEHRYGTCSACQGAVQRSREGDSELLICQGCGAAIADGERASAELDKLIASGVAEHVDAAPGVTRRFAQMKRAAA